LKKTKHEKGLGGVAQSVGPEFKPQYHEKNKTKQKTLWPAFICFVFGVLGFELWALHLLGRRSTT
jgi:hypothetical protein